MFCFQVSKFEVHRAVEPRRHRGDGRIARSGGELHLLEREERHLAEALRLPDRQREERRPERGREEPRVRRSGGRAGRRAAGPPRKSAFAGFSASATPANVPARTASRQRSRLERAHGERGGDEHRDHRREVRLLGEAERLRKELVDPRVVVALDEVGDREKRRGDERRRAPEPGQPAGQARADVVDRERRDRPEHARPGATVVSGSSSIELEPVIHVSGASSIGQPWLVSA